MTIYEKYLKQFGEGFCKSAQDERYFPPQFFGFEFIAIPFEQRMCSLQDAVYHVEVACKLCENVNANNRRFKGGRTRKLTGFELVHHLRY